MSEDEMQTTGHGYDDFTIKAFVISMLNDHTSTIATRNLLKSIEKTNSMVQTFIMPATEPHTIDKDLKSSFSDDYIRKIVDRNGIKYTWPKNRLEDRLDISTGLYLRAYAAADWKKVAACTVSHMRLWQHCVDIDEPILILEHDAIFERSFRYKHIALLGHKDPKSKSDEVVGTIVNNHRDGTQTISTPIGEFSGGIIGINSPLGATRKAMIYHNKVQLAAGPAGEIERRDGVASVVVGNSTLNFAHGICQVPYVDDPGDSPLPNGLAGNSAYIIKPWAAQKLLDKTAEIGIWPNDALMCRQFFPWLQQYAKYITKVQGTRSTTTT